MASIARRYGYAPNGLKGERQQYCHVDKALFIHFIEARF
jgi:hypothetical protein